MARSQRNHCSLDVLAKPSNPRNRSTGFQWRVIRAVTMYSRTRTAIPIPIAPALAPPETCGAVALVALVAIKVAASVGACIRDPPGRIVETGGVSPGRTGLTVHGPGCSRQPPGLLACWLAVGWECWCDVSAARL